MRGCYERRERGILYSPSDDDSRKFGDGKPMKVRRLEWDSCLCHCVESSSNAKLTPFSTASWAKLREAAFVRQDITWSFIEGMCNDKPRGFYHRNCYKAYTRPSSLKRAQRECWPVGEGVFSSKPSRNDDNISTGKRVNASGSIYLHGARYKEAFVHCVSDGRQKVCARPTKKRASHEMYPFLTKRLGKCCTSETRRTYHASS